MIIREYFENLYCNKLENLEEWIPFYKHMTYQDNIRNLNSSVSSNEFEAIIKDLPTKKSIGLDSFTDRFYEII
jgi:hypothetical protein